MPDTSVFCGGLEPSGKLKGKVLYLSTNPGASGERRVNLNLGAISQAMVQDMPDRLADLIEIAAYVYCADQFTKRDTDVMREMGANWHRTFRFHLPVRDLPFWQQQGVKDALVDLLTFLSEDSYHFVFAPAGVRSDLHAYLDLQPSAAKSSFRPDRVALFSGGLDSFAGAAEAMLQDGEKVALVSHQSAPFVHSRQDDLVDQLRQVTNPGQLFHVGVRVNKGDQEAVEFTQRSRSFLFASLAFVVARLFAQNSITFYENGVVSLNLPLAEHVLGARATRTTHPMGLAGMSKLFSLVADAGFAVINPYMWLTKSDVVCRIEALGLGEHITNTFSCAHVRGAAQLGSLHCGRCSQCIDRRFGILAAGAEQRESAENYAIDILAGAREPGIETVLAQSFVRSAINFSSMTPTGFLSRYGQVFRALPYLAGSVAENVDSLHDLHRRHGQAVMSVLDRELAKLGIAGQHALPDTCLLSLVQTQTVRQPTAFTDIAETELPAPQQAAVDTRPLLPRPIVFALDSPNRRVVFAGGPEIRGQLYVVFAALHELFKDDRQSDLPPASYRRLRSVELAKKLGLDEPGMRQTVQRARNTLKAEFGNWLGVELTADDVIENIYRQGYRLNPYLAEQPLAVVEEANHNRRLTGRDLDQGEYHANAERMSQSDAREAAA